MAAIQQVMLGYGSATVAVTWNPADKAANIVLSGSNLIAGRTGANGYQSVRATQSRASGKYYCEVVVGAGTSSSMMVGIATAVSSLNTFVGGDNTGYGYNASNGGKYNNGNLTAFASAYSPGDVIQIAFDATAGKLWFGKNGTWLASGDPATAASPAFTTATSTAHFPMASIFEGATGQTWIGRFKSADFSYSPPSGFSPWE